MFLSFYSRDDPTNSMRTVLLTRAPNWNNKTLTSMESLPTFHFDLGFSTVEPKLSRPFQKFEQFLDFFEKRFFGKNSVLKSQSMSLPWFLQPKSFTSTFSKGFPFWGFIGKVLLSFYSIDTSKLLWDFTTLIILNFYNGDSSELLQSWSF